MNLATLDLVILCVIGLSALLSLFRGFSSEFLSLMTWLVAILMPFYYTEQFMTFLPDTIESEPARWFIAAGVLFFGVLIIFGTISFLVKKIIGATSSGLIDRFLGACLGALRGGLIVALIALLATAFPSIPREGWWNSSRLLPIALVGSKLMYKQLPDNWARFFTIDELPGK